MAFRIKRIYEPADPSDGIRVLVDRIWPRGMKKSEAHLKFWIKEIAPSTKLRLWFAHSAERFAEFRRRYIAELAGNPALAELRKLGKGRRVTLLYAARDHNVNHAVVLLSLLRTRSSRAKRRSPQKTTRPLTS